MTQVAPGRSERVSRARRWCSRAVLVIGGAVVGTAAAWAVSTASAGADQADAGSRNENRTAAQHRSEKAEDALSRARDLAGDPAHLLRKGAERASEALGTGGEPHLVGNTGQRGDSAQDDESPSPGSAEDLVDVVGDAEETATQSGDRVQNSFMESCEGALAVFEAVPGSGEQNPFEGADWQDRFEDWFASGLDDIVEIPENPVGVPLLPGTLSAPSDHLASLPGTAAGSAGTVPATVDAVQRDGTSRGFSDDAREFIPELPSNGIPLQMPGAPAAPSAPNSGHAGHGNADGSTVGATFGSGSALDAESADMALVGTSRVPFEPGRQPGVTPD